MTQPRRRLRRRSTDNDNEVIDFLLSDQPQDTLHPSEVVSTSQHAIASNSLAKPIANDDLDPIRTELLNDFHHHNFTESEYWDESHNWSDDDDSVSDEYWHFLGLFE